jgi:hypothetical protein
MIFCGDVPYTDELSTGDVWRGYLLMVMIIMIWQKR